MTGHARIITDEGGLIHGVVVNLGHFMRAGRSGSLLEMSAVHAAKSALCAAIPSGDFQWREVTLWIDRMHLEVGAFRWVPRSDSGGIRSHIEPAEPGSRGSWLGAYWSET